MRHFRHSDFPEPWADAHPLILEKLDDFRDDIGKPIIPSKAHGALCRYDAEKMGSPHYAVGRRSTAVDVFIPDVEPAWVFLRAMLFGFGAVGVYFDTHNNSGNPETMYHLDVRDLVDGRNRTCWYREHKKYNYARNIESAAPGFLARIARGYDG